MILAAFGIAEALPGYVASSHIRPKGNIVELTMGSGPVARKSRVTRASTAVASDPWYDSNWTYRVKITIDSTKVSSTLSNFPVLITEANLPTSFFTNVKSDGTDIVFTLDTTTTTLDREVVNISTASSTLEAWVRIASLPDSSDTDIYLYYGNASANEANSTDTWNSDFRTVLHLNEDPSGSAPQMQDSTSNNEDYTTSGSMTSDDLIDNGKIGKSLDLDGTNDFMTNEDATEPTDYTFAIWINPTNANSYGIFCRTTPSLCSSSNYFSMNVLNSNVAEAHAFDGVGRVATGSSNIPTSTWTYLVATGSENDSVKIYVDGLLEASTAIGVIPDDPDRYEIGAGTNLAGNDFPGMLDEVHLSTVARSAQWIITSYNNQDSPSTFYSVGSEETE